MDYLLAILHLPSSSASSEKQLIEFSNVSILITRETQISIDVVKHTLKEYEAALTYGSICLSLTQLFEFLTLIDRTKLRTCFTIFIQTTEFDSTKWNLESIFPEVHYHYQRTSITRERILDADQACTLYPFLNTKIGKFLHHFYLEIYHRYYNEQSLLSSWNGFKESSLVPSSSSVVESNERNMFNANEIERKKNVMNNMRSGEESTNLLLSISHLPHDENISISNEFIEQYPNKSPPVYKPVLYDEQRYGERSGLFKSLFSCMMRTEPKFMNRIELERYDNVLYHGIRDRVCNDGRMTAIEILARGGIVKNGIKRKRFYSIDEIQEYVSPMELCEYVSREWNVEIELLLPLIHYAIKSADMVMAQIISDSLKNLMKIKRLQRKRIRSLYLIIGKRCSVCTYDQISYNNRPHYHIELLDKLFHQDLNAFKRYTILAFEILRMPLNVQKDGEYLELELF